VTVTAATVYVGLYGWTAADLPMLRVNESAVTPAAGETFAPSLVYVSRFTSGSDTCANITYEGNPKSLCPGDVQKLT
jgi:hypothetical protein